MAEGINLGSAYGRVLLDASDIRRGIQEAQSALRDGFSGMSGMVQNFSASITNLGKNISLMMAPFTAFGVTGLNVAKNFDSLMKQIELFGGVSGKELDDVRAYITKLGAESVFSSQQAGEALLNLLKTGMNLQDSMAAMPKIIDLATAGNIGLARSSEIVTGVLAAYKMSAKDANKITDALARGANASAADVGDLGDALSNVAPVAKLYGLGIDETVAILGTFANNNIKGAEAGTQLKSMLLNLYSPTKGNADALSALGVQLYDNKGRIRDLNIVIREMDAAMNKLPVSEQNELMQELGGSYGILGLSTLRAQKGYEGMLNTMSKAPDAAEVATKAQDTFAFSLDSLGGSIETLQTNFLSPFMNKTLKPLVGQIIGMVNSISEWAKNNPELANTIATVAAGVAAFGAALLVIGPLIGAIGGIIAAIASPIGLLIGAVALLGVAFANNWFGIRDLITNVWAAIQPVLEKIRAWFVNDALPQITSFIQTTVQPAIQRFFDFLRQAWDIISPHLTRLYNWFVNEGLPAVLNYIQTTVIPGVQNFINLLVGIWDRVSPILLKLLNWFMNEGLPAIGKAIGDFRTGFLDPLISILQGIWTAVQPALSELFKWFSENGLPIIQKALDFWKTSILQPTIDLLAGLWKIVSGALQSFAKWFQDNMPAIQKFVTDVAKAIEGLIGWIDKALNGLRGFQSAAQNAQTIASGVAGGKWSIGDVFNATIKAVGAEFGGKRDSGGEGIAGQMYLIGRPAMPEAFFVPPANGQFIPNVDRLFAALGRGGAGDNGGPQLSFAPGSVIINANGYAEGAAAADGFSTRLNKLLNQRG